MKNALQMLMLLLSSTYSFAQSDSILLDEMKEDILRTNKFYLENQLDLQGYDFSNAGLNKELYAAAISKKKSEKRATTGGILIGLGLASVIASAAYKSDDIYSEVYYGSLGVLAGTMVALASIPFFTNASKHKRESQKHIKIAREMYGG